VEQERYARLFRYSNLEHLKRFTFDTLTREGRSQDEESRRLFAEAYEGGQKYAEAPSGWLVLTGPSGSGKTHLAAAIGARCIEQGRVAFYTPVADLLDHLRATFSPASEIAYSDLFEQVRGAPLLILDGLGGHSTTAWAEEKLRQIITHRFDVALPTVITTMGRLEELDEYILSRLRTPEISRVLDLRSPTQGETRRLGGIATQMLKRMTFESFDLRGNDPSSEQGTSLEAAYHFAKNYAADPDGWVTFFGETGVGKTHLAVAIAVERIKAGQPVFFAMVADLMDHLRAAFGPGSSVSYDDRFEEVKSTPLLILDDLGKERSSPWAEEKLHQIISHRYNTRSPTVITSMLDFTRSEEQGPIGSRIQDQWVGELIRIDAPDYRRKARRPQSRQGTAGARRRRAASG
jgi:DNA replication protein DnaC